jgi:hypothetical protein
MSKFAIFWKHFLIVETKFMKILFINPLSKKINICIYNFDTLISTFSLEKTINLATYLPKTLVDIVESESIQEIWCIHWPGAFTLMRTVTLIINSLKMAKRVTVKSWHLFDIIPPDLWKPLLQMNEKEFLVGYKWNIMRLTEIEKDNYVWYIWNFSELDFTWLWSFIEYKEDTRYIYDVFSKKVAETQIYPIYFKPPHITSPWLSKKNISHS